MLAGRVLVVHLMARNKKFKLIKVMWNVTEQNVLAETALMFLGLFQCLMSGLLVD